MNFERGLTNLDDLLKRAGLTTDSDVYLDFIGWKRQLVESVEDERRFAGLSPQGQERRERILRELDRLALKCAGESFVDLCTGKLAIEAFQQDSASDVTPVQVRLENTSFFDNAYALLIGIAAYRHVRPLTKTTTDARDLCDTLLRNGYSSANVALLLDEQATKPAISGKLDWLAGRAGPNGTVVIFFSGHGAQLAGGFWPGEYLCPVEAALDKVKDTFISDEEFTNALRAIRAGRLVVFLDACHAGGVGEPKDPAVQIKAGLSEAAYSRFLAQGRVIIASCKLGEVSYELPEMRNSLFTHYLLEGLRGGAARQDGTVWMSDLFGYVYKGVSQHNLQHPFQKSAAEDFIIAITKQLQAGPQPPAPPPAPARLPASQLDPASLDPTKLRKAIHSAYDRPAFEILCKDLGLDYHDLRGETLETKMLYLIDHFQRHRQYEKLVHKVLADHPHLKGEALL